MTTDNVLVPRELLSQWLKAAHALGGEGPATLMNWASAELERVEAELPALLAEQASAARPEHRNWAEDAEHENGNYYCRCCQCNEQFIGHKRRVVCRACAHPPAPVLDVELARKAFWRGFESARCMPNSHDIQAAWADASPNLLSGHAPLSVPPAPAVPEGWKLVPVEPTNGMLAAWLSPLERSGGKSGCDLAPWMQALLHYRRMLEAGPKP